MKIGSLLFAMSLFCLLLCCISQTLPNTRFRESTELTSPSLAGVTTDFSQPFVFSVVSDLHIGGGSAPRFSTILDQATAASSSFVVLPGDLTDDGKEEDFLALTQLIQAKGFNNRSLPVIGNHDIFASGWTQYKRYLGPSHYSVQVGPMNFIVLDTADGIVGSNLFEWFENELKKNRSSLVFVVSHYAPVTPGIDTYLKLADEVQAIKLLRLAKDYGVKAWFSGHYHSYSVATVDGVDYVLTGGGGGRRMDPVRNFFFVNVRVDGTNVSYQRTDVD